MKTSLNQLSLWVHLFLFTTAAFAGEAQFPSGPDRMLTPGELCSDPDQRRYPERIAYCERQVGSARKDAVVAEYDSKLGYRVAEMGRQRHFKIDHYIPLCMGGANTEENLWPQHLTISEKTDPLEQVACEKMAKGKLKQAEAIRLIKAAKNDLTKVPTVFNQLQSF